LIKNHRNELNLLNPEFLITIMKGFHTPIEREARKNSDFRRVLYTGKNSQLVLMSLRPMEEIGMEVHVDRDQFFRFEEGEGKVVIDGVAHPVRDGDAVIVPAGAQHNVVNTSKTKELKLYTIYSPPEHQDKVIRHTKADALASPEEYDGKPTE
jgi:mannose-6-phosphate isomerase-like protein (cupin superfamily)